MLTLLDGTHHSPSCWDEPEKFSSGDSLEVVLDEVELLRHLHVRVDQVEEER